MVTVLGGDRVLQTAPSPAPADPDEPHLAGQAQVTRKIRSGWPSGADERAGRPARAGEAGRLLPSHGIGDPAAERHARRRRSGGRLLVRRPSSRCSTITTARIEGTDRRLVELEQVR